MLTILPGEATLPQQSNIGLVHKFGRQRIRHGSVYPPWRAAGDK